jgi:hypothetical protein
MKEFMEIWVEPFQEKALSRSENVVLGVAVPAAFIAMAILINLLP